MGRTGSPTSAMVVALLGLVVTASCSSGAPRGASSASTTSSLAAGATSSSSRAPSAVGSATWSTYFHDSGRSGMTSDGPAAPAAVRRQWASQPLDGDIYAQPLVVASKVVVATENDTVYALDAATGTVVWDRHVGSPVSSSSLPCGNIDPVGITSTPVVDMDSNRVYVSAMVQPGRHVLFALDLTTGSIVASASVDGPGADPFTHNQRGALALVGGRVVVPFGGNFGDCGDYHGVLAAVPVTTAGLGSPGWYTLPSGREGGFWAPPGPVVAADGSLYLTSGNTASTATYDYANTVLHLSSALTVLDSFAPSNWAALSAIDSDLGSTNPVLVGGNRVFQIGKAGIGYLLDEGHLGGVGGQLAAAPICQGEAMGGVSHMGSTVFVPCPGALAAVSVAGDGVVVRWTSTVAKPGPAIITSGAVWTVATSAGELVALDVGDGKMLSSQPIGAVPSEFTSPAAGLGRVVVAAERKVLAFGD